MGAAVFQAIEQQSGSTERTYGGVEVSGLAIQAIVEGFQQSSTLVRQMLLAEGIGHAGPMGAVDIDTTGWYPLDRSLRVIHQISELGDSVLFHIGGRVAEGALLPPWVHDIHHSIQTIDAAFHANHRKNGRSLLDSATGRMREGIGHYLYERAGERRIQVVVNSPYPCAFDRGLLTARARRFQPKAWVLHDDQQPCRKRGAPNCTYQIVWI
ncbi:MAG TPA: hypothetical protein VK447_18870 [Myxococcaceae bacterium]|nr:hypothetical protein [Myxococcaceae bacterium]